MSSLINTRIFTLMMKMLFISPLKKFMRKVVENARGGHRQNFRKPHARKFRVEFIQDT